MKYIITFLFSLAITGSVFAQASEKTFIEVKGIANFERNIKSYILDIVITEDQAYAENKRSLEQVKKAFFDKAKTAGLDNGRFKEDKLTYALTQYSAGGSLYYFETDKPEELIALNKITMDGTGAITINARRVTYLPVKNFSQIVAAAFADGKARAEKLAVATGKKLGALKTVIDYSTSNEEAEETTYYQPMEKKYYYLSLQYFVE